MSVKSLTTPARIAGTAALLALPTLALAAGPELGEVQTKGAGVLFHGLDLSVAADP